MQTAAAGSAAPIDVRERAERRFESNLIPAHVVRRPDTDTWNDDSPPRSSAGVVERRVRAGDDAAGRVAPGDHRRHRRRVAAVARAPGRSR